MYNQNEGEKDSAEKKAEKMSNTDLKKVWAGLIDCIRNSGEMYDKTTTIEEWAEIVYTEISKRGL